MKRIALGTAAAVLVLTGGAFAYRLVFASGERADCPGKIICAISGEEICRDRCPLIDPDRSDGPGKTECPLTGEPVCADRCPLGSGSTKTDTVPSCCAQRR